MGWAITLTPILSTLEGHTDMGYYTHSPGIVWSPDSQKFAVIDCGAMSIWERK